MRLTALVALLVLAAACGGADDPGGEGDAVTPSSDQQDGPSPATSPPGVTSLSPDSAAAAASEGAWAQLESQIGPDGDVSLDLALQAFSMAVGSLPGVDSPSGEAPIFAGTDATRWLIRHWDGLTADQQQAAHGYLQPPITEGSALGAGAASAGAVLGVAMSARGLFAAQGGSPCVNDPATSAAVSVLKDRIRTQTSWAPDTVMRACIIDESKGVSPRLLVLNADGGYRSGDIETCLILVPEGLRERLGSQMQELLAYHVFACFEAYIAATIPRWTQLPGWLVGGSARWVAAKLADGEPIRDGSWVGWLSNPTVPLFSRTTDALGFFALMEQSAQLEESAPNPWEAVALMLTAVMASGNESAYLFGISDSMANNWGSGYFQDQSKGDSWFFDGPGIAGRRFPEAIDETEVADGVSIDLRAEPYAGSGIVVDLQADVVVIGMPPGSAGHQWEGESTFFATNTKGLDTKGTAIFTFTSAAALEGKGISDNGRPWGRVSLPDKSDFLLAELGNVSLCTLPGGCTCPEGSPREAATTLLTQAGPATFGVTGHTAGTEFLLSGYSLEDFCDTRPSRERDRFVLTFLSWEWEAVEGLDTKGCSWPAASVEGTILEDSSAYLDIDTTSWPWKYQASIFTTASTDLVTLPACEGFYSSSEIPYSVAVDWFRSDFDQDPWKPMATSTLIAGDYLRTTVDPFSQIIQSWQLRRTVSATGE